MCCTLLVIDNVELVFLFIDCMMLCDLDSEFCFIADESLSRSEYAKAELEMEVSRVRLEAAGLRDALLKMQALNEGLGQDKVDLNKMLMQVS